MCGGILEKNQNVWRKKNSKFNLTILQAQLNKRGITNMGIRAKIKEVICYFRLKMVDLQKLYSRFIKIKVK